MGLFSRFKGGAASLENRLINEYAAGMRASGISQREAHTMAQEMLASAKQEVSQRGLGNLPTNYGDWLLQHEPTDSKVQAVLQALRDDGVRDEDVRWWWNMSALERVMIEKSDELNRTAAFMEALRQGLDGEGAAKKVCNCLPPSSLVTAGAGAGGW